MPKHKIKPQFQETISATQPDRGLGMADVQIKKFVVKQPSKAAPAGKNYVRKLRRTDKQIAIFLAEKEPNGLQLGVLETEAGESDGVAENRYGTIPEIETATHGQLKPHFRQASALALPKKAPELYVGNRGGGSAGENIVDFLRRVWKPWIDAGVLSRPDLKHLDPKAYEGIRNWTKRNPMPPDLILASKSEAADAEGGLTNEEIALLSLQEKQELLKIARRDAKRLEAAIKNDNSNLLKRGLQ